MAEAFKSIVIIVINFIIVWLNDDDDGVADLKKKSWRWVRDGAHRWLLQQLPRERVTGHFVFISVIFYLVMNINTHSIPSITHIKNPFLKRFPEKHRKGKVEAKKKLKLADCQSVSLSLHGPVA